jgi:glycosyltransferase involved in cell wall biosynthesis
MRRDARRGPYSYFIGGANLMKRAIVSVIIPAYNAEKYIAATLHSCLAQSLSDIEIIVVDDGSSDRTAQIVEGFDDSRLCLLRKENGGVSSARNHALRFASGRYVQFLDADDILDSRKIEEQYLYLNLAGNDGISTSRWGWFVDNIDDAKFVPAADWQDLDPIEFAILKYGGGGMMPPNTWMIPRALIGDVRFHSSLDAFEDGYFLIEILRRSKRVYFAERALSFYRKQNPKSLTAEINYQNAIRQFMSVNLSVDVLLHMERSDRMAVAAANSLMKCAVRIYPLAPGLGREAERKARALANPTFKPEQQGGVFGATAKVFGWRFATSLRYQAAVARKAMRSLASGSGAVS